MQKKPKLILILNEDLTPFQWTFDGGERHPLARGEREIRPDDNNLRTLFMIIGFTAFKRAGGDIDKIPPNADKAILKLLEEARRKEQPTKENFTWFHAIFGKHNPRLEGWINVGGGKYPFIKIEPSLDVEIRFHEAAYSGRILTKNQKGEFYERYLPIDPQSVTVTISLKRGKKQIVITNDDSEGELCFGDWGNIVIEANFSAYFLFVWIDSGKGVAKLSPKAHENFQNIRDKVQGVDDSSVRIEVPRNGGVFPVDKQSKGTEIGLILIKREPFESEEIESAMKRIRDFVGFISFQVPHLVCPKEFRSYHLKQYVFELTPPRIQFNWGDQNNPDDWQKDFSENLHGFAEVACFFSIPKYVNITPSI